MDRLKRKSSIRASRFDEGFTLTETLVATILLVLATGIVAMGVNLAQKSYRQQQFLSQAEVLAGTIDNALADPFRYVKVETATTSNAAGSQITTTYKSIVFNGTTMYDPYVASSQGRLYLLGKSSKEGSYDQRFQLINEGAYGNCQVMGKDGGQNILDPDQITPDDVSGSYTIRSGSDSGYSHDYSFYFKPNEGVTKAQRSSNASS